MPQVKQSKTMSCLRHAAAALTVAGGGSALGTLSACWHQFVTSGPMAAGAVTGCLMGLFGGLTGYYSGNLFGEICEFSDISMTKRIVAYTLLALPPYLASAFIGSVAASLIMNTPSITAINMSAAAGVGLGYFLSANRPPFFPRTKTTSPSLQK